MPPLPMAPLFVEEYEYGDGHHDSKGLTVTPDDEPSSSSWLGTALSKAFRREVAIGVLL
jgi:hypothetical protein